MLGLRLWCCYRGGVFTLTPIMGAGVALSGKTFVFLLITYINSVALKIYIHDEWIQNTLTHANPFSQTNTITAVIAKQDVFLDCHEELSSSYLYRTL